jgi:uncharacterized protein YidB (DUF937 family)
LRKTFNDTKLACRQMERRASFEEEIMVQFDQAVKESVPGNDFVKPLMIAAGALILGHIFGKKDEVPPASVPAPGAREGIAPGAQTGSTGGGIMGSLGSLGGMLNNLANSQLGGAAAGATAGTLVTGGLDNLLKQFRKTGQGPAAESWIGTGQNHPVTAEQINAAIGHGKIAEIAQAAGISTEQMSQLLAQSLPKLIDKLTPGGQIKQG